MIKDYIKLPLRFQAFFEQQRIATCNMQDSIFRNLHLLITTVQGESSINETYGAAFWDFDYDIHLSNDARREIITNSLKEQIRLHEKRITQVEVNVTVKLAVLESNGIHVQRRRIEIIIKGAIIRSMEPITFQTGFFIGPLTMA